MKKIIRGLSLVIAVNLPLFAQALEMKYSFAKIFTSVEGVQENLTANYEQLNQLLFRKKSMELSLKTVARPVSYYQVEFELKGKDCEPSAIFYEKVKLNEETKLFAGTLLQMGFIIPTRRPDEPMNTLPESVVLIPYCQPTQ